MPISFTCPHCGVQMNVADQYAGQTGPCGKCGATVTIPGGAGSAASPYPAQQAWNPPPPSSGGGGVSLTLILAIVAGVALLVCGGLVALLLPAVGAARQAARRAQSGNNLRQIGLAMHNYHDTYNAFPLAGSEDPQHGIGLSWRVRVLPFIEESAMYGRVNFNEPWDGANNRWLTDQMPRAYQSPSVPPSKSETVYLAVVDSEQVPQGGTLKDGNRPMPIFSHDGRRASMANITDGTSNTIMTVEADVDQAVTWSRPKDWTFDPQQPRRGLGKTHRGGFLVQMADGSIRFISNNIDDETLRNLMTRNDGQVVTLP